MARFYVTGGLGGELSAGDTAHFRHDAAVIAEVDTDTGDVQVRFTYQTPAAIQPPEGISHVFKAGSWDGDLLMVCTLVEILWVDPATWTLVRRVTHPWFNDLHHVARLGGRVRVACTGLDGLLTLSEDDTTVASVDEAHTEPVWDRHHRDTDYRKVLSTQPHPVHLNYVFEHGGRVWGGRFKGRDAVPLAPLGTPVSLQATAGIHDGIPHGGFQWFTSVDGAVYQAQLDTGEVKAYPLSPMSKHKGALGWCRGIAFDGDVAWVGFSRLRRTKWKENLNWLRNRMGQGGLPARLAGYRLATGEHVGEVPLDAHQITAVFSVLPAQPESAD